MRKGIRKFFILVAVFIVALFTFSKITNHETKDLTTDMPAASLPIVSFEDNGHRVNELHGYTAEMSAVSMRDTITPLPDNHKLSLRIDPYGKNIDSVTFEVRSLDGSRLVQDGKVTLSGDESAMKGEITVENLLEKTTEYQLILKVKEGDTTASYYTRIKDAGDSQISTCVDFVEEFHAITMDKDRQSELASYMEPSADADNTSLQTVTINNSLSQACWGDLQGTEVTEPVASIKEMCDEYQVILLEYILSADNENGQTEYYNVQEYYRVRVGAEKIYLLNFERTMEEIFQGDGAHVSKDSINLGIRSDVVDYKANETGNIICFVQQGELWSYNQSENKMTQVFSFRSGDDMDIRENYDEHAIRILKADEGGSIDFVVYGYMNRGEHEGQVGVSVCHYDCVTNTVEEMLFIPTTLSYQVVKEQLGTLMYVSDNGYFYLTISDQVYKINLDTKKSEIFISDLQSDMIVSSEDGRHIAWSEDGGVMHVTDLEKGDTYDVNAESGQTLKPLGFIGSDCIYGWGYTSDVFSTDTQTNTLALSQVLIMDSGDSEHQILKTYQSPGMYVTGIRVQDGSIYLSRVAKSGDTYTDASEDTIMNRDMQDENLVNVSTTTSTVKQTEVVITLSTESSGKAPKQVIPKQILNEESVTIEMKNLNAFSDYYVYAKGQVIFATKDMAAAIQSADENKGVVIGKDLLYVWRRGESQTQEPLEISE